MQPKRFTVPVNGIRIAGYEWPGEGDPIVLVHATGFHGRCWNKVVQKLLDNQPGRRVIALDLRGHGASDNTEPPFSWQDFADDVIEVIRALDLTNIFAVGHSMGGHLLVLAAAAMPERFRQLLLVDPVILDPQVVANAPPLEGEHPIARRRNRWPSSQVMLERFAERSPFKEWDQDVLKDYCDYGLLPAEDGSGECLLACPPHIEGEIYLSAGMENVYNKVKQVTCPVRILRARERMPDDPPFDFGPSTTWSGLAKMFPHGEERYYPELSHFIPMERPELVVDQIEELDR